jgi:membrane protein DedA with SNARE-associated domain
MADKADSYKEAHNYCRSAMEYYFKLGTMSFALNALLIAALSYTLSDNLPSEHQRIRSYLPIIIVSIGVVYNLGALIAYRIIATIFTRVRQSISDYERDIRM